MTKRYAGAARVAGWLGAAPKTVSAWRRRGKSYGIPFPEPDIEIETSGVIIPGWDPERKPEVLAWKRRMPGLGRKWDRD